MFDFEKIKNNDVIFAEQIRTRCKKNDKNYDPDLLAKFVDEESQKRYKVIKTAPDTIVSEKNTWYVSSKGRKDALGNSPEDPFDSLTTLEKNRNKIKTGDAVLLARGEVFRGECITSVTGVNYGAFGLGEKPLLIASIRNYISDKWYCIGNDIWTCDVSFPADVGNIIFNNETAGYKKLKIEDLINEFDFYSDHEKENQVFIKLSNDPKKLFNSIEIAHNFWMFRLESNSDITVENLSFAYIGGHGIRGSDCKNITIRGCEFYYIGGSYLTGYGDGTVRYGNAIEFMSGSCNILVEDCYAYQIYDSGVTHQGLGYYCAQNIIFKNNLFSHCGMGSIEYWLGKGSIAKDVTYTGNIMRYAGYGFGGIQRPDKNKTAHIQSNGFLHNHIEDFKICNNIFDHSTNDIVNAQSIDQKLPQMDSNIYIQSNGGLLGSWGTFVEVSFDENAETVVSNEWHDTNGIVAII